MKNYTIDEVKMRIEKLNKKPVENAKLVAKWRRLLRKLENSEN